MPVDISEFCRRLYSIDDIPAGELDLSRNVEVWAWALGLGVALLEEAVGPLRKRTGRLSVMKRKGGENIQTLQGILGRLQSIEADRRNAGTTS